MKQTEERDCVAYENVVAWTKLSCAQLERKITAWKKKLEFDMAKMKLEIEGKQHHIGEQDEKIVTLKKMVF